MTTLCCRLVSSNNARSTACQAHSVSYVYQHYSTSLPAQGIELALLTLSTTLTYPLVSKAKVKPLVAFVCGRPQVLGFLLLGHGIPDLLPPSVDSDVEDLCAREDTKIVRNYAEDDLITGIIVRFIGIPVDLDSSVTANLEHEGKEYLRCFR